MSDTIYQSEDSVLQVVMCQLGYLIVGGLVGVRVRRRRITALVLVCIVVPKPTALAWHLRRSQSMYQQTACASITAWGMHCAVAFRIFKCRMLHQ